MEFKRFASGAVAVFFLTSYAPTPRAERPLPVDPVAQMNMDAPPTAELDPIPTERGRYICHSRQFHGEPVYFTIPKIDDIPDADCLRGTTVLLSRTIGDTTPPPAEHRQ